MPSAAAAAGGRTVAVSPSADTPSTTTVGRATTRQATLPAAARITVRATGTASTAVASLSVTAVWVDPVSSRNRNGPFAADGHGHDDLAGAARGEPRRGDGPGVRRDRAAGRGERRKRHQKRDFCSHAGLLVDSRSSVRAEARDGRDARVMFRGCLAPAGQVGRDQAGHGPRPGKSAGRAQAGRRPGGGRAEAGPRPGSPLRANPLPGVRRPG